MGRRGGSSGVQRGDGRGGTVPIGDDARGSPGTPKDWLGDWCGGGLDAGDVMTGEDEGARGDLARWDLDRSRGRRRLVQALRLGWIWLVVCGWLDVDSEEDLERGWR